jgi:hypothetical protein
MQQQGEKPWHFSMAAQDCMDACSRVCTIRQLIGVWGRGGAVFCGSALGVLVCVGMCLSASTALPLLEQPCVFLYRLSAEPATSTGRPIEYGNVLVVVLVAQPSWHSVW